MGIADRDYMRERYLERQGLPRAETRWNEQKARVDLGDDYFTGSWRTRIRHHQARQKAMLHALLLAAGSAVVIAGVTHRADVMRGVETLWRHVGWSSFPATGTVSVSPGLRMDRVKSRLTLQGAADSAIVQLREPATGRHVMSVYVRPSERTTIAAPTGRFSVHFIRGSDWQDTQRFFGDATRHDQVIGTIDFTAAQGHILDLRLGPDSNLVVRRLNTAPEPLS